MKFREYGKVKPLTLVASSGQELDLMIYEIGSKSDIIDLQFAITYKQQNEIIFSALLLVKERENVLHKKKNRD